MKVVAGVAGFLPFVAAALSDSCSSATDAPAVANSQLQVAHTDHHLVKQRRGNTEADISDNLASSASVVIRLHSAAEQARAAAHKMRSQWDASTKEIHHLLGGFEGHMSDSQDGCGSQLHQYQHQLQLIHESVTSIYEKVNVTESDIYLHDHVCREKDAEISVLKKSSKQRYQKCETQTSSSKKTLSVLKADIRSMQKLSTTSIIAGGGNGGYAKPRPVYGLLQLPRDPPSEERVAGVQSMVQEAHDLSQRAERCVAETKAPDGAVVFLETAESEDGPYKGSSRPTYPGQPPVPPQCQQIVIQLQHVYSEAYVSLERLVAEYEEVTHSTVCTDTVKEEYQQQVSVVQGEAEKICNLVQHEIKDLDQYKVQLQTSQSTELKLKQSIKVLTKQCGGLQQTEHYLHEVSSTITALGKCIDLDNFSFKIPTWVGSWTTFRQDRHKSFQDNDQYMNQACVKAFAGSFGEVRAAEMAEIDTKAIEEMPATNTHNLPLLGACPACKGDKNDNSKEGYGRLCWDDGEALTHGALRGDCNSGERAVMCVYDGQSHYSTTAPPETTEPPQTTAQPETTAQPPNTESPETTAPPGTTAPPMVTPQSLMTCDAGDFVATTSCMTGETYDRIVAEIKEVLHQLETHPQADWAGCVLRMAGHDFMDFANGQGGSDACTDMRHPDNAGLAPCLANGESGFSLNQIYAHFCTEVSLADFLVISAEGVMSVLRQKWIAQEQAVNPTLRDNLDFKSKFRFGRTTAEDCAMGELPNPEEGCDEFDRVFLRNMGLDLTGGVALMGVHTLGRARPENSGYDGWWSDPENSALFNNNYYVSLLAKGWMPERTTSGKHQWTRADMGAQSGQFKEMMLNTDICFLYREDGQPVDARDELSKGSPCCAWVDSFVIGGDRTGQGQHTGVIQNNDDMFCGTDCTTMSSQCTGGPVERTQCCGEGVRNDCGSPLQPDGKGASIVQTFAENDLAWASAFAVAWTKATENGFRSLQGLADRCP